MAYPNVLYALNWYREEKKNTCTTCIMCSKIYYALSQPVSECTYSNMGTSSLQIPPDIHVHAPFLYIIQGAEPSLDFQQAVMACQRTALNPDDFSCIQLVYGNAGELFLFDS